MYAVVGWAGCVRSVPPCSVFSRVCCGARVILLVYNFFSAIASVVLLTHLALFHSSSNRSQWRTTASNVC